MNLIKSIGKYAVLEASAGMLKWSAIRKIGLVEVEKEYRAVDIKMISQRGKGVKKVVRTWNHILVSKKSRTSQEYRNAISEALNLMYILYWSHEIQSFSSRSDNISDTPKVLHLFE